MSHSESVVRQTLLERAGHVFPSPFFDIASQYIPRNMKDVLKWAEYLFFRSGIYRSATERIARYPITDIQYGSEKTEATEKYRKAFEKQLNMKETLGLCGTDCLVYGNSFVSLYLPFDRFIICPNCSLQRLAEKAEFEFVEFEFVSVCPCGYKGVHKRKDVRSIDIKRINIIRWDPKDIEINYHPISGRMEYYWNISARLKKAILAGDKSSIIDTPWEVMEAIKNNKIFKFSSENIFHMKQPSLSGVNIEWGLPNFLPVFSQHYYMAVLRRANEAIALDYIMPFRVLHPAAGSSQSDPTVFVSMGTFVSKMREMVRRHRRDPVDVQIAPIPIGYQALGAEGKALMVTEEMRQVSEEMLNSLGYPADLFYGNLKIQSLPSALRLFENQWSHLIDNYNKFLQWFADKLKAYFDWPEISISLQKLTIADDIERKSILLQLAAAQQISRITAFGPLGIDIKEEEQRKLEEMRIMQQVQMEAQEDQLAQSETGEAPPGMGPITPFDLNSQAQELASQLLAMPYEMRRSELNNLSRQNETLYALVKMFMEKMRNQAATQQGQQMLGGAGAPPPM